MPEPNARAFYFVHTTQAYSNAKHDLREEVTTEDPCLPKILHFAQNCDKVRFVTSPA